METGIGNSQPTTTSTTTYNTANITYASIVVRRFHIRSNRHIRYSQNRVIENISDNATNIHSIDINRSFYRNIFHNHIGNCRNSPVCLRSNSTKPCLTAITSYKRNVLHSHMVYRDLAINPASNQAAPIGSMKGRSIYSYIRNFRPLISPSDSDSRICTTSAKGIFKYHILERCC